MDLPKGKYMTDKLISEIQNEINQYEYWYHGFEVVPGVWTKGEYKLEPIEFYMEERFDICNLSGKRILDIATFDGGFAFGFEDLGAEVVAIDIIDQFSTGFSIAKQVRNSTVSFDNISVYELDPEKHGNFDFVHYSGIHYHLKHPIMALEKINSVIKPQGVLFGHGTSGEFYHRGYFRKKWLERILYSFLKKMPLAYYLDGKYRNDPTNWILFNDTCMQTMMIRAGFQPEVVTSSLIPGQIEWGSCYFKAIKSKAPEPEYWPDNHKKILDTRPGS